MSNIFKLFFLVFQGILIKIRINKLNIENKLIRYIKFNIKNITMEEDEEKLLSIINYVKSLKERKNKNIIYKEIKNPKVSFISPVFNQVKFLPFFISSIQNQKLKEFELMFIDDFSNDKSVQFIEDTKKKDERIKFPKVLFLTRNYIIINKKNKGTLYSRYIGQKLAKAKYSIFVDCDDEELFINQYYLISIIMIIIIIKEKN